MDLKRFLILLIITCFVSTAYATISLASYYGNHMVLQKAPKTSYIWGYADLLGEMVTVTVGQSSPVSTIVYYEESIGRNIWKVMLPPQEVSDPVNITVSSTEGTLTITDVLFGDVWVCSGQSNMQFTLSMALNASQEIAEAVHYPHIRLFTPARKFSAKQEYDFLQVEQHWSHPNKNTVGHQNWTYFSAVCWLYGKYLYQQLKYPIGLIASDWGGTPVEAWSSRDAINACMPPEEENYAVDVNVGNQDTPTYLWNAMIHPLLNLTIYGAIWYQGEANAKAPNLYSCSFPAMIDDWREKFNLASDSQTDILFPFGFVQLAPNRNNASITTGFPDIRWHQTADIGFVPNPRMPNTFMAVAVDLPDFASPFGSVHPRDKQDVAARLVLSALPVAYNITRMGRFQGPRISAYFIDIGFHTLTLELDNNTTPITVKNNNGFEVCCSRNNQSRCDGNDSTWIAAPIIDSGISNVTLRCCNGQWTMGIRYLWRESPCTKLKMCAVYTVENDIPMAPFISVGLIGSKERNVY